MQELWLEPENFPAVQELQVEAPPVEKDPAEQGEQEPAPEPEDAPLGQFSHVVKRPSMEMLYFPASHEVHLVSPESENVPASQFTQSDSSEPPSFESFLPAGQFVQRLARAALYFPLSQMTQLVKSLRVVVVTVVVANC